MRARAKIAALFVRALTTNLGRCHGLCKRAQEAAINAEANRYLEDNRETTDDIVRQC